MKLPVPQLDDRTHDDIVRDAKALIREYLPEWTDLNPSDPGVTLVELFAWMTEMIIYRLNRVPEKMALTLLNLMGVERKPPTPSRALLTFEVDPEKLDGGSVALPQGTFVDAAATSSTGDPIRFTTESGINLSATRLEQVLTWAREFRVNTDRASPQNDLSFDAFQGTSSIERWMYIGSEAAFAEYWSGSTLELEVRIDSSAPSTEANWELRIEYWDGDLWQRIPPRAEHPAYGPSFVDETGALTRDGILEIARMPESATRSIYSTRCRWLRIGLFPKPGAEDSFPDTAALPSLESIRYRLDHELALRDLQHDRGAMFLDAVALSSAGGEPSAIPTTFYPFGKWPSRGDWFCFSFDRPMYYGGRLRLDVEIEKESKSPQATSFLWEYFYNGRWRELGRTGVRASAADRQRIVDETDGFEKSGQLLVRLPRGVHPTDALGQSRRWIRVTMDEGPPAPMIDPKKPKTYGPRIRDLKLVRYKFRGRLDGAPAHVVGQSDFEFSCHTRENQREEPFRPFTGKEKCPALYLGFDRPFPAKRAFGVHVSIVDGDANGHDGGTATVRFEYWNGSRWREFDDLEDHTRGFSRSGFVQFVAPDDHSERDHLLDVESQLADLAAARERLEAMEEDAVTLDEQADARRKLGEVFEDIERLEPLRSLQKLYWIRAVLVDGSVTVVPRIRMIRMNTVSARNEYPMPAETLGSSDGTPDQRFFISHTPIDGDPQVAIEEPDPDSGGTRRKVWQRVTDLLDSSSSDEHYTFDDDNGEVRFGDGRRGKIPIEGRDNIVASYGWHCGADGDLGTDSIQVLVGSFPHVKGVTNYEPAGGGSSAEAVESARVRGRESLRHRHRAVSLDDFEHLARSATRGVARACAIAVPHHPGEVLVRVIPAAIRHNDSEPDYRAPLVATPALLETVQRFIEPARLVTTRVRVTGPKFREIKLVVQPRIRPYPREALTIAAIEDSLFRMLHPTLGGPNGEGWPFGRPLAISEVYAAVERVEGVDYVEEIRFLGERGEELPTVYNTIALADDELLQLTDVHVEVRRETRS